MFIVKEFDPRHQSFNLKLTNDDTKLIWNNAPAQDVLIVQYPYGGKLDVVDLASKMNERGYVLQPGYVAVGKSLFVRYVSVAEKTRKNGCELNGAGCSYVVISCTKENPQNPDSDVSLFVPEDSVQRKTTCDVPLKMDVFLREHVEKEKTGLLRRGIDVTFFGLSFEPHFTTGYTDGDLYYEAGDDIKCKIPITRDMVFSDGREFYIKDFKPEIKSSSKIIDFKLEEV